MTTPTKKELESLLQFYQEKELCKIKEAFKKWMEYHMERNSKHEKTSEKRA